MKRGPALAPALQLVEKGRRCRPFPPGHVSPAPWGAAGETCRETLLRKASEPAAHVAGFGLYLEGFGPPNLPKGVFRRSGGPALAPALDLSNKPGIAGLRPSKPIFRSGTRTIVSVPPTARQCSANGQGARKSPAATAKRGCGLLVLPILRQPDRRVSHAAIAVAQTPRCEGGAGRLKIGGCFGRRPVRERRLLSQTSTVYGPAQAPALSLSTKAGCAGLCRQDTFPLRLGRGRGNVQGNLAAQGFRTRRACRRVRIVFGGLRPSKPPPRGLSTV